MQRFAFDLAQWFTDRGAEVERDILRYFDGKTGDEFTGRWFEHFAAIGDPNRFEASDLIAVETLSVKVESEAAATLLVADPERFNNLLRQIPREQDIWELRRLDVNVGSSADKLWAALKELPDVGWVTAGKLLAAKRPRLIPILDDRVNKLLNPREGLFWVSMHDAFVLLALGRYFDTYEAVTPDFTARLWLGEDFAGEQAFHGRSTDRRHLVVPMTALSAGAGEPHDLGVRPRRHGPSGHRLACAAGRTNPKIRCRSAARVPRNQSAARRCGTTRRGPLITEIGG
jgi:hypothetical protein